MHSSAKKERLKRRNPSDTALPEKKRTAHSDLRNGCSRGSSNEMENAGEVNAVCEKNAPPENSWHNKNNQDANKENDDMKVASASKQKQYELRSARKKLSSGVVKKQPPRSDVTGAPEVKPIVSAVEYFSCNNHISENVRAVAIAEKETKHDVQKVESGKSTLCEANEATVVFLSLSSIKRVLKLISFLVSFVITMWIIVEGNKKLWFKRFAFSSQSALMKLILKAGNSIESRNELGETLLAEACRKGDVKAAELFLACGSDIDSMDAKGESCLAIALQNNNHNIASLLLDNGAMREVNFTDGDPLLIGSIKKMNSVSTKLLIDSSSNLNIQSKEGEYALDIALYTRQFQFAEDLLIAGANPNIQTRQHEHILNRAVRVNDTSTVVLLLEANADPNVVGIDGFTTPLLEAVFQENFRILEMLLKKGAYTETENIESWTPLLVAVEKGLFEIVYILIKHGANVNATTKTDGKSCLMWAIVRSHDNIAALLIESGADFTIKSKAGNQAIAIARQFGQRNIVCMIERASRVSYENRK